MAQSHILLEESAILVSLSVCDILYSGGCDHVIVLFGLDVADNSPSVTPNQVVV